MAKRNFSESLKKLFGIHSHLDDSFFESITDMLVEGDIGAQFAFEIEDKLRAGCKNKKLRKTMRYYKCSIVFCFLFCPLLLLCRKKREPPCIYCWE